MAVDTFADAVTSGSAGPDWASIITAIGTVAVAIVAIWVALFTERRSDKRVADERAHSAAQLDEERKRSDDALAEERRVAMELEQFAEASAVQVIAGMLRDEMPENEEAWINKDGSIAPVAMVINHGRYTITGIAAYFIHEKTHNVTGSKFIMRAAPSTNVPPEWTEDFSALSLLSMDDLSNVLTPWDVGLCLVGEYVPFRSNARVFYPLVRWTDRWGLRWQYKRGEVRQIPDNDDGNEILED